MSCYPSDEDKGAHGLTIRSYLPDTGNGQLVSVLEACPIYSTRRYNRGEPEFGSDMSLLQI